MVMIKKKLLAVNYTAGRTPFACPGLRAAEGLFMFRDGPEFLRA
jgi:hypothetical protein